MKFKGRMWIFTDKNLNTDQIFPGKYTYDPLTPEQMAEHALEDYLPNFAKEVKKGDIIVDFPNIFPVAEDIDLSNIHFKSDKKSKTNYSCFSVYCSKENSEIVEKAVKEFVKLASKTHLSSNWINKF